MQWLDYCLVSTRSYTFITMHGVLYNKYINSTIIIRECSFTPDRQNLITAVIAIRTSFGGGIVVGGTRPPLAVPASQFLEILIGHTSRAKGTDVLLWEFQGLWVV